MRDRSYERNMDRGYIDLLNQTYEEFFSRPYDNAPVLVIDSDPLDFVRNAEHLDEIENRIRQALNLSPYQPVLIS